MPAIEKLDWEQAYDEFILVHKPKGMKQYEFAALKEVNPQWLSVRFKEIEGERLIKSNRSDMPRIMAKALKGLEEALDEDADRSVPEFRTGIGVEAKAKLSLAAASSMADRLGMSPQAMTINMQQLNQNKTVLAVPIFAAQASPMMDKFLGSVDADTKTDS